MQAITQQNGTITVQPNFAYSLAVKRVEDERLEEFDLSQMRVAMCGAEPINPEVLRAFQDKFGRAGLPEDVIMPVYGMAEATLAVSFRPPGAPLKTARLNRAALQNKGAIVEAGPGDDVFEVPSVGEPLLDTTVKIVDEEGFDVGDNVEGEILIQSPSVMRGYHNKPEETAEALKDGWFHSGDLGFTHEGELYVTGRIKDVIITYGRNFYPHDIERVAQEVRGIRKGCVAAFGIQNEANSTQEIVVVGETRETERDELIEMRRRLRKELINAIECNPRYVVLVGPRAIPKTTSGKLRRNKAAEKYHEEGYDRLL
jgi:acyl-CoA synthetase (AMP-forming)/AMP-acid ligase II